MLPAIREALARKGRVQTVLHLPDIEDGGEIPEDTGAFRDRFAVAGHGGRYSG